MKIRLRAASGLRDSAWLSSSTVTPARNVTRSNSPLPAKVKRVGPDASAPAGVSVMVDPLAVTATVGTGDWATARVTGIPRSSIAPQANLSLST
jgi:hypothetical protein